MDEFEVLDQFDCDDRVGYPLMSVKSVEGSDKDPGRFFKGVLNSNTIDRDGERYEPKGVDIRGFKAAGGPVVVDHYRETTADGFSSVVARVLSVVKANEGIIVKKAEFDTDPLSEHWRGKVHRGFVKAMSAGLLRKKAELRQSKRDGKQHVVVTDSELIHVKLTSQPANRESLIAAKSIDRIAALELRVKNIGTPEFLNELVEKMQENIFDSFTAQITELSDQVANLVGAKSCDKGSDSSLSRIADALSGLCGNAMEMVNKSHPELPDAAFIIETGAERNSDGTVVRKYRHLPHHTGSVKSGTEHTTINKALLRNALARLNQVQPAKESAESFRSRAERHLRRHASALGIGRDT